MRKYIDADELIAICNIMATQEYAEIWHQFSALVMWQQTADVEPRWIPVTERLPEEHEEVLTYDSVFGITFDSIHNGKWRKHPVAWMPLPTPYRGGVVNGERR